jgi:hypothetical protein
MFRQFVCTPTVIHKHSLWAGRTARGGVCVLFGKSAGFSREGRAIFAVAAGFM